MSISIRKILGTECYKLIQERNSLILLHDCSQAYGDDVNEEKIKERLIELHSKIESLKLLRSALKEDVFKTTINDRNF
jgi:hypothetical protein